MQPTIRDARPEDAQAVAGLVGELGYPTNAETMLRRLKLLDSSEADRVLVAEVEGKVVGLASVHVSLAIEFDQPAAKLSAIVVGDEYRGRGIGTGLLVAIETEARSRGCGLLFLTTAEHRTDAHTFYRRIGFEETAGASPSGSPDLAHDRAAVDVERRAGDVGGIVGDEVGNDRGDLLRATESADRDRADHLGQPLRRQALSERPVDRGRRD